MDEEVLRHQLGSNIAAYRKRSGLTQAGLAEKLNYSDKAVSKWERGESVPDVMTLMQLAELFRVPVGELLSDPSALPADQQEMSASEEPEAPPKRKARKGVILALSSTLVWFVALLAFVILSSFRATAKCSWLAFFYAIPVNAIVLLSLRSAWRDFGWNRALISTIMWGFLLAIYATIFVIFHYNFWKLFLLGIPGQIAICLWFRMFHPVKETKNG